MKTLTAIVVEDERLPRLALLQKLEAHRPQIEVIDSCDNYDSALQSIVRQHPDVLFLDIQLQGRDSIGLLEEVGRTMPLPYVVFTTAYADRRYLMSAIKLDAVDYLLKPVDKSELALAIAKILREEELRQPAPDDHRLCFRTANGKLYVNADDIAYILADGNYAHLTTFFDTEDILESLGTLTRNLDPHTFVRTDRSTIVNVKCIYKINARRRLCTFKSNDGHLVDIQLSKTSIDQLLTLPPSGQ